MRSPLLGALPAEEVELLMRTARRRQFARNEVVFHRGDPADTLHFIHRGRFAVRITTPLGDTVIVSVLGPGDCFGERGRFAGGGRCAAGGSRSSPAGSARRRWSPSRPERRAPCTSSTSLACVASTRARRGPRRPA